MAQRNYGTKARSPSQREQQRKKAKKYAMEHGTSENGSSVMSHVKEAEDVKKYLSDFQIDDLGHIIRDRKSSKKLHTPMVGGHRTDIGEIRKGNSVPQTVIQNKEYEHGVSSYFRGQHINLSDILSNQYAKESMIKKIVLDAADKIKLDKKKKLDWRNNAFYERSASIQHRVDAMDNSDKKERELTMHLKTKYPLE